MLKNITHISFLLCCLYTSVNVWAGDPPPPPANSSFAFNFMPLVNRSGVDIFAACGIGNLPVGMGAKGNQMCDDNMAGPGGYKERFVHDGYIPNNTEYLLEQKGDLFHQVLIDYAQNCDCVATSLPILGVHAQNRLTYATADSFCPDRPASAASPYGIVHKWTRHTTTRLPQ